MLLGRKCCKGSRDEGRISVLQMPLGNLWVKMPPQTDDEWNGNTIRSMNDRYMIWRQACFLQLVWWLLIRSTNATLVNMSSQEVLQASSSKVLSQTLSNAILKMAQFTVLPIRVNLRGTDLHTVDGRNPAPPGMHKTLSIIGYLSYQLVSQISAINRSTPSFIRCHTKENFHP